MVKARAARGPFLLSSKYERARHGRMLRGLLMLEQWICAFLYTFGINPLDQLARDRGGANRATLESMISGT